MDFTSLFGSAGESGAFNSALQTGFDGAKDFTKTLTGLASGNPYGQGWGNSSTVGSTMSLIDGVGKSIGSLIALAFM